MHGGNAQQCAKESYILSSLLGSQQIMANENQEVEIPHVI